MQKGQQVEVSVFQKAKRGHYYCGDSYFYYESDGRFICALADGLGSGELAKESSQIVMEAIRDNKDASVTTMVKKCSEKLMGKRGVVLGILQMDFATEQYTFSSIGNIGLITISSQSVKKRNIPQAGYLGGFERPFKVMKDKLEADMVFVLFSDGVSVKQVSNLHFPHREVTQITDTLAYLNHESLEDDTTLIAMKYKKEPL